MGCITKDYKDILSGMLEQKAEVNVLGAVIRAIPLCEVAPPIIVAPSVVKKPGVKRGIPTPWGIEPIYIDENKEEHKFSSPSAVVKHLGLPMSGSICDPEGKKCKAASAIDILRIAGYFVDGDGEPRKASAGGEKIIVYHPDAADLIPERE